MASFIHEKWLNCEILIDTIHTDILPVYGVELWISYLIHLLSIWDFRMRQEMRPLSKQWKTLFNQRIEISAIYSTTVLYDFQAISICHFWHCREPRLRYRLRIGRLFWNVQILFSFLFVKYSQIQYYFHRTLTVIWSLEWKAEWEYGTLRIFLIQNVVVFRLCF